MAFWRKLGLFLSGAGYRQTGVQTGIPQYDNAPAVNVTLDTALQLSAVWACSRLIAETVSSLPICVYDVDPVTGVRKQNKDHPVAKMLSGKVNRWQTKQEFFETITYQLCLLGNAYAVKQRNTKKELIGLQPLMSEQMEVALLADGKIAYKYQYDSNVNVYSDESIWHLKLMGNGVIGLNPLAFARRSIGIGQGAEDSVTSIYRNGGKPSGILTIDKVIAKDQREAIKSSFSEMAAGTQNRLFVLEAGMQYHQISLSPQDIELLASRRFQIEDICRFFGVPSVLVNDTQAGTTWGSGIQQIVQGWYKLGLRPYLERIEASMKCWLLTPEERLTMDIEFDFNALLRPDQLERIKMYKEGVQGGIMTPNEGRKMEGWEEKEGGDVLLVQQQMVPITMAGEANASQNAIRSPSSSD